MQPAQPQAIPTAAVLAQYNPNVKDSRWLTLEVCREFTRSKCSRSELECKFAHPPPHVEVQQGRVTCCFDSIKGKCQRKDPPCKYLHPPQHLREQLLQNGRNNLILKNIYQMQLMSQLYSPVAANAHPYLLSGQQTGPFINPASYTQSVPGLNNPLMTTIDPTNGSAVAQGTIPTIIPTQTPTAQATAKLNRPDRLENTGVITSNGTEVGASWQQAPSMGEHAVPTSQYSPLFFQPTVEFLATTQGKKRPRDPADDLVLGMAGVAGGVMQVPMKRPAVDKSGIPMYQPSSLANPNAQYQMAAMQLAQQQQFVPVTNGSLQYTQFAGHPASVPRF